MLFGVLVVGGGGFGRALRFGFFHRLACIFRTLGADLGALLLLFFLQLLRADELDHRFFGAVTALEAGANNAQVAALAITEARPDGIEEFRYGIARHEVAGSLAPRGQVA